MLCGARRATRRGKLPANAASRPAGRSGPTPIPSSYGFATVITLALVNHPWLLDRFAEEVASLEIRDKTLAALLQPSPAPFSRTPSVTRERLAERLDGEQSRQALRDALAGSAFKRVAFLQPESPEAEVEEHFADLIYRFRALPSLTRELQEGADHLADVTEAEFERFAQLQQQVASVG